MEFTKDELLGCIDREITMRLHVYPSRIERGSMTRENARKEVRMMKAIRQHLNDTIEDEQLTLLPTEESAPDPARELLEFINLKTGRHFPPVESNLRPIRDCVRELVKQGESNPMKPCKQVVAMLCREWTGDMRRNLKPRTVFHKPRFMELVGRLGERQEAMQR